MAEASDEGARAPAVFGSPPDPFTLLPDGPNASSIALVDGDVALTRGAWAQLAWAHQAALTQLPPRCPAALVAETTPHALGVLAACFAFRVPVLLLHPRSTLAERKRLIEQASCGLLAESGTLTSLTSPSSHPLLQTGDQVLIATSGSSAEPRLVVLTRAGLLAAVGASQQVIPLTERSRWGLSLPFSHVGGLSIILRCWFASAAVVLLDSPFGHAETWRAVDSTQTTHLSLVPTQLRDAIRLSQETQQRFAGGTLSTIVVGGAESEPALRHAARSCGLPVRFTYGMTEMGSQVATQAGALDPSSSDVDVGFPLPGMEIRLTHGDRILVRGASMARRYLDGGAPLVQGDGFFHTNDRGSFDALGRLVVHGRLDDVIISGGENVSPPAVEAELRLLEDIHDACVVGVPDDRWGECVVALVVAATPCEDEHWQAQLRTRLAPYSVPKVFIAVDALPRLKNGKVDRRAAQNIAKNAHQQPPEPRGRGPSSNAL